MRNCERRIKSEWRRRRFQATPETRIQTALTPAQWTIVPRGFARSPGRGWNLRPSLELIEQCGQQDAPKTKTADVAFSLSLGERAGVRAGPTHFSWNKIIVRLPHPHFLPLGSRFSFINSGVTVLSTPVFGTSTLAIQSRA